MDVAETGVKTAIHVISESPHAIVVQYPANISSGIGGMLLGLVIIIAISVPLYRQRAQLMHGFRRLVWLVPLVGLFPIIADVYTATTVITVEASAETGMLTVRRTVAGSLAGKTAYPLENVQRIQLGFDRGCKYIYAELTDGSGPKLLPCSPMTGYNEAAQALNAFLDSQRASSHSQ